MQLRWLVARHCQLQRPPVPCAWIDFDVADPRRAVMFPWLILLELARQLDLQIPGAPFHELVQDYERYLPLLSQAPEPGLVSVDEGTVIDAEDIAYRFCAALAEARSADAPVVLLLDTMEEVVLRSAGDASGFAETLEPGPPGGTIGAADPVRPLRPGRPARRYPPAVRAAAHATDRGVLPGRGAPLPDRDPRDHPAQPRRRDRG